MKCNTQDSKGNVCGKEITQEEIDQDGMCYNCADNIFIEMTSNSNYKWEHNK